MDGLTKWLWVCVCWGRVVVVAVYIVWLPSKEMGYDVGVCVGVGGAACANIHQAWELYAHRHIYVPVKFIACPKALSEKKR